MSRRLLLLLLVALVGCAEGVSPETAIRPREDGEEVSFIAAVTWVDAEGGFWGLVDQEGQPWNPITIPAKFREEGHDVAVRAEVQSLASIRMWGTPIRVLSMQDAPPPFD